MIACVVDIETTGTETTDQIVEIGSYLVEGRKAPSAQYRSLVAPTIPIPPTASAVHHITAEDLVQAAAWPHVKEAWLAHIASAEVMVAHNAKFECQFLAEATAPRSWICTMKCAMRAWPDAPGFGNQVLRYWRNPKGLDRRLASESHRSLPDAYVTAFLLTELLTEHPIERLITWSAQIAMPPRLNFGKHKGTAWVEAPLDYLDWIANKSDMDEDTKALALYHIERRPTLRTEAYLTFAKPIIQMAESVEALTDWWRRERAHRHEYGLFDDTDGYAQLVEWCRERRQAISAA